MSGRCFIVCSERCVCPAGHERVTAGHVVGSTVLSRGDVCEDLSGCRVPSANLIGEEIIEKSSFQK